MEPHSEPGTHKLELPVSRTTLKDCGGVPRVISEKSVPMLVMMPMTLDKTVYIERS